MREISVFLASPSDLMPERKLLRVKMENLNLELTKNADVRFKLVGFEDVPSTVGIRPQSAINQSVDTCEIFILTLYRQWGQDAPDAEPYSSYTEEEFHRALERMKVTKTPTIFVFFKDIPNEQLKAPDTHITKILEFKTQIEQSRIVFYKSFKDDASFIALVASHLKQFVNNELPHIDRTNDEVVLPLKALEQVKKALKEVSESKRKAKLADNQKAETQLKAEQMSLKFALHGSEFSSQGEIVLAKTMFSSIDYKISNYYALNLSIEFYTKIREFEKGIEVLNIWLDKSGKNLCCEETALGLHKSAQIYCSIGDIDSAMKSQEKALDISNKIESNELTATCFGGLGVLYGNIGDFKTAKNYFIKALNIFRKENNNDAASISYLNLAILNQKTGHIDKAISFCKKSAELLKKSNNVEQTKSVEDLLRELAPEEYIDLSEAKTKLNKSKQLGDVKGIVNGYGIVGSLLSKSNNPRKAEKKFRKSLVLSEKTNSQRDVALTKGNLAIVKMNLKDFDAAEKLVSESLKIYKNIKNSYGIAQQYVNLGCCYYLQRKYEKSKIALAKSIKLSSDNNNNYTLLEAQAYCNLGSVCKSLNENEISITTFRKSIDTFKLIESKKINPQPYLQLGMLYQELNSLDMAQEVFEEFVNSDHQSEDQACSVHIFRQLGDVYCDIKMFEESKTMYIDSMRFYQKTNDLHGEADVRCRLGYMEYRRGNFSVAFRQFQLSWNQTKDTEKPILEAKKGIELCYKFL